MNTKIRQIRHKLKLSIREAAEKAGMSASTWHQYERGLITKPTYSKCVSIQQALGRRHLSLMAIQKEATINSQLASEKTTQGDD